MRYNSGLRFLFDQLKLNSNRATCFAMITEFDFEIRYIKGKENRVVDALGRRVQVNHITTMSSYGTNL